MSGRKDVIRHGFRWGRACHRVSDCRHGIMMWWKIRWWYPSQRCWTFSGWRTYVKVIGRRCSHRWGRYIIILKGSFLCEIWWHVHMRASIIYAISHDVVVITYNVYTFVITQWFLGVIIIRSSLVINTALYAIKIWDCVNVYWNEISVDFLRASLPITCG